jgi:hypothetical protein
MVRLVRFGKLIKKNSMASSELESATFRFTAQRLNKLRYHVLACRLLKPSYHVLVMPMKMLAALQHT